LHFAWGADRHSLRKSNFAFFTILRQDFGATSRFDGCLSSNEAQDLNQIRAFRDPWRKLLGTGAATLFFRTIDCDLSGQFTNRGESFMRTRAPFSMGEDGNAQLVPEKRET
jgi:hypothetical protein